MLKQTRNASIALAIALLVAACGGGGGGGTSAPAPAPTPLPVPVPTPPTTTPENIQKSVPEFTYQAGSEQRSFATALNGFRAALGLGLFAQNERLDKAASNHLAYVLHNDARFGGTVDMLALDAGTGRPTLHIENATKPFFTGVQERERAIAAGYAAQAVGEEVTFGGGKGSVAALESLVGTVYHRQGLMTQRPTDVGVAVGTDASQTIVIEVGSEGKVQTNASDYIAVYPADKQTGVGLFTRVETPNPIPDLSTANDDFPTKTGYPISISVAEGVLLTVQDFKMTEKASGMAIDARVLQRDNDSNKMLSNNIAFLIAKSRLKPGIEYQVSFSGAMGGKPIAKSWSFSTLSN